MFKRTAVFALFMTLLLSVFPVMADLPPRPDEPETPVAPPQVEEGATIVLHASMPPADLHTMVQWQHPDGTWYTVEGWQGTLNDANLIAWWVAPNDLKTGPYRWVGMSNGEVVVTSDEFMTPSAGQKKVISVSFEK